MEDLTNLKRRVNQYKEVLNNTIEYRKAWKSELRQRIENVLGDMNKSCGLEATIQLKENVENLEAIVLDLGQSKSGISERVNEEVRRPLIKHNGSLVYQQLFNGKIIVLITYPLIEGYGEPRPPKTIAIYRPEELKPPFFVRHMEDFIKEITNWEDFDDDEPSQKIGFKLNFLDGTEGGGN
ncbi:MAG: hypothetical protein AAF990_11155 [Bacteroidota bacterium]